MKRPQQSSTTIITSPQQRKVIEELEQKHLEEGGSIFAQVFHDGLRVKVLTPTQTQELSAAFSKALGTHETRRIVHSVFDAAGDKP
ncbi:hypothetical protein CLU88_4324 [Acidovorax sp. 56]|uniref:hypothetical protein n=1 Tax=Acidovorax sp. 56 TaxID=2035205 RepID=UPI000C170841|nr:hypothetical protein [Acidovorax sp. 56]PIF29395.1 hypothetical protein CLU88_4324 [Acidovorax sp. 56]